MANSASDKCGLCGKGKEVESRCGRLYTSLHAHRSIAAHKMCMQYASGLSQFKNKCKKFGRFAPEEVLWEIARGKKLVCAICRGSDENKKPKKRLSDYDHWMKGATAGCAWGKCPSSFHFPCVRANGIFKRIKKTISKRNDIEIQYKVYCSKDHLELDWKKLSREGKTNGFTFTNSETDDEEAIGQNGDGDKPGEPSYQVAGKTKPTDGAGDAQENPPSEPQTPWHSPLISDESDFDMESSPPYPSQTATSTAVNGATAGKKKTKQSKVRRRSPVIDSDSEENSSEDEEMIRRKRNPRKKATAKATSSPLVPHAKLSVKSTDTPVGKEGVAPRPSLRSTSKKLTRPNNQPMITGFLPEKKHVKKLFSEESGADNPGMREGTDQKKYMTVSIGDTEMFLFTPERNNGADEDPKPSTSSSRVNNEDKPRDDDLFASSDSDIEILEVKLGDKESNAPHEAGNNNVQPDEASPKRPGSPVEEREIKKIKLECQSLDADSTSEPQQSETSLNTASMPTDENDCSSSSNLLTDEPRATTPVISKVMGAEDYILCVTETRITDAAQGIRLAKRVHEATGCAVPLKRIAFWRHSYDASEENCSDQDMQYRLLFMEDWAKHIVKEKGDKLNQHTFLLLGKEVENKINLIRHSYRHFNKPGDNNPFDYYLETLRNLVKDQVKTQSEDWKIQCISDGDRIVMLIHIGDQLDPQSFMRKKLNYGYLGPYTVHPWERNNREIYCEHHEPTEIVRYFSITEMCMVDEAIRSNNGGFSAYFDSSFTEWWKEVETKSVGNWVDGLTTSRVSIYTKPEEKALRDTQCKSIVYAFKKKCQERNQNDHGSEESENQTVKERALMFIYPVLQNVVNVAEYIKLVVPQFCETMVTARNGKEAVCVADVKGMSLECLANLVRELHVLLENYDVTIVTGVEPGKGPITCLCLHVVI